MLDPEKDPLGNAILDYYKSNKKAQIKVRSDLAGLETIPVDHLFRSLDEMPELEKVAFTKVKGSVLDIGAGAGCHSLLLQKMGMHVTAIDVSPGAIQVISQIGINNFIHGNIFDLKDRKFDTLLMLMNGIGIVGDLQGLDHFLNHAKKLLKTGGQIILDSSDIKYMYEENDGSILLELTKKYYGEMTYQMQYKNIKGDPFKWLYVNRETLNKRAAVNGYSCEIAYEGEQHEYLAILRNTEEYGR